MVILPSYILDLVNRVLHHKRLLDENQYSQRRSVKDFDASDLNELSKDELCELINSYEDFEFNMDEEINWYTLRLSRKASQDEIDMFIANETRVLNMHIEKLKSRIDAHDTIKMSVIAYLNEKSIQIDGIN